MSSVLNIVLATTGGAAVINALGGVQSLLGGIAAAATSTTAALAGINSALDLGGQLTDLSFRTGQVARDLVVMNRAFDTSGVGAANTAPMIGLLQKAISGLNEEGGKTEGVFKRLGTSAEALKPMSALDQMRTLTRAFERVKDPSERAALAMQLFGRSGAQMLQLLGDSSALSTAEREVGRLATRVADNAAKFDEVGDRLSLAKLRLQEFYVVAAEKAIPALERMADLIDQFNPSVLGAVLGNALAIVSALGSAAFVKKLDTAVLDWATKQGSPVGQAFAGRFLAPLTGALARILPIGLAAAIGAEVLKGLVSGYAEWRNQQLAGANAGFDAVGKVRTRVSNVRSEGDVKATLADVKDLEKATATVLAAEESRFALFRNDQAIASYRQQLASLRQLAGMLTGEMAPALIAQNKLLDQAAAHAKRLLDAKEFLASDSALKLRTSIQEGVDSRRDPGEQLANARAYLALQERVIAIGQIERAAGRNDAINQENVLKATAERERTLKTIADIEKNIAQTTAEKAQRGLELQMRIFAARKAELEGDYARTEASKWPARKAILEQEIAAQKRYLEILQARHDATSDPAARATLGGQIRSGIGGLSDLQNQKAQLGPDPSSWLQESLAAVTQLQNQWGTTAQQIGTTISGTIGSAVTTVSQGLTGWIVRAGDWRQKLLQGAQTIGVNVVQSIVQMGVTWVANLGIMAAKWLATKLGLMVAEKGMAAASTAALIPIAAVQSAIWSAPATLATIASAGTAAISAPGEIAASISMTRALAAIPGFLDGDFTGGRRGKIAGFVHGEEFVFSAPAVDAIGVDNLRGAHAAALAGDSTSAASAIGGGGGGADAGGAVPQNVNVTVISVSSQREATRIARQSQARGDIVRIVEEDFGIPKRRA
ncbi:MAG: hypothetical protein NTV51_01495 [Verrucomicrobia bacterium]|nr:hypothetical protein [Verrucomicrobiota bacterium]